MAAPNPAEELGRLVNGPWIQYATAGGQDYYYNEQTGGMQYAIPNGYTDHPAVRTCE